MRILAAVRRIETNEAQQLADAMLNLGAVLGETEGADRIGDDVVDAPARIEAGVGILKDHLNAAAQRFEIGTGLPHVLPVDRH